MTQIDRNQYMEDTQGRLVPLSTIKAIDIERHNLVYALAETAQELSDALRAFREKAHSDLAAFVNLSMEDYGVKVGGDKGNVTLYSFDGRYKITRDISDVIAFDERLKAAKALIDARLKEWSRGANAALQAVISDAFQVDNKGRINTKRILSLRRIKIDDPEWEKAMQAISDSVQIVTSRSYIRIYERDDKGEYDQINLDLANANYNAATAEEVQG